MATIYKLFACEVLRDEVEHLLLQTPPDRTIEPEWMEMGLHDQPEFLHKELLKRIAACEGKHYAAILLLFGLCSRSTAGLTPPSDSRLIVPKAHDCVTLFLGSVQRFQAEHQAEAGTYWFSRGFLHRPDGRMPEFSGLGAAGDFVTRPDGTRATPEQVRQHFIEEYGEENAEYLMETLVESWKKNYRRAVYLDWPENKHRQADYQYVCKYAQDNNWIFDTMPVDLRLVKGLLFGPWPESEFLTVLPGEESRETNDEHIIGKRQFTCT